MSKKLNFDENVSISRKYIYRDISIVDENIHIKLNSPNIKSEYFLSLKC